MREVLSSVLVAPLLLLLLSVALGLAGPATPAFAQQRTLCVHGLEPPTALLVRSGPSQANAVIGRFPAKACGVRLTGRCDGDWCQMTLGETSGWVKTEHIAVYELPGLPANPTTGAVAAVTPPPAPVARPEPPTQRQTRRVRDAGEEQGSTDGGTCVTRVDRDDTLRIRRGPGVSHDEIGEIPPKACGVAVSDTCRGRWCRIAWRGRTGWVNTYYLD